MSQPLPDPSLSPTVSNILANLRQIETLIVENIPDGRPGIHVMPKIIHEDDWSTSLSMAEGVSEQFGRLYNSYNSNGPRLPSIAGLVADMLIRTTVSGARNLVANVERQADKSTVEALSRSQFSSYVGAAFSGQQFLEVLSGERSWSDTIGPEINIAWDEFWYDNTESIVSFLPFFGTCYDLGMAIWGKTFLGRNRSIPERVLLGFGAMFPLLGGASRLAKVSAHAVIAAKVARLGPKEIKGLFTFRQAVIYAVATRQLTEVQATKLVQLAQTIQKGSRLTEKEIVIVNRLFSRMNEAANAAEWLTIAREISGKVEQKGVFLSSLQGIELLEGEKEAGEAVARLLNEQVIALPKIPPIEYREAVKKGASFTQLSGAKAPDQLIGREFADVFSPKAITGDIARKMAQAMADKHGQGGTLVVNLFRSPMRIKEFLTTVLPRFWGKPEASDVVRVIVLDAISKSEKVILRPVKFGIQGVDDITRGSFATSAQLLHQYSEAETDR